MRLPRVRFTIRRMMIAVALFGVGLGVGLPLSRSLVWLYNSPFSINLFSCNLDPWTDRIREPIKTRETVKLKYPYACEIGSTIPPWLPYLTEIEVRIVDAANGTLAKPTIVDSRKNRHLLMNGLGSSGRAEGGLEFELNSLPPGYYVIRYEARVTDLFGRTGLAACNNAGFAVR